MEADSSASGHQYKLRPARRASASASSAPSVDATTDRTWAKRKHRPRLKRFEACVPCVIRKVRCKGGVPCSRCWEYALVCKPQDPLSASPGSASPEQSPAPPVSPSPPSAADTPAAGAHAATNPFLEAFLRQWNPALVAPAFVEAMATLLPAAGDAGVGEESVAAGAARLLDRGLVEAAIRRWRGRAGGQSTRQGLQHPWGEGMGTGGWGEGDGTYGVVAALERGLVGMAGGGAPVEGGHGTSPGGPSAGAEGEERQEEEGRAVGAVDAQVARARPLQSSIQGDSGPARLLWSGGEAGDGCVVGNVAWDAVFIPAGTALRSCTAGGSAVGPLGPMLLLGACVHPNDRCVFFRALTLALFGSTSRPHQRFEGATQVIKACTARGKVGLFLLRASRAMAVAAGTDILLSLEPVPPSRYILDLAARSCAVIAPPAFPLAAARGARGGRGSPRGSDDGAAPAPDADAAPGFPWGLVACPLAGAANDDGVGGGGRGTGVGTAAEVAAAPAAAGVGEEEAAALFRLPSLEALAALRSGSLTAWWLELGRRRAGGGLEDEDEDEDEDEGEYGHEQQQRAGPMAPQQQQAVIQAQREAYLRYYAQLPLEQQQILYDQQLHQWQRWQQQQQQQQHPHQQLPPPQQQQNNHHYHQQQQRRQRQPATVAVAPEEHQDRHQHQHQHQHQQSDAQQLAWSPELGAMSSSLSPLGAAAEPWLDVSVLDSMFLDDRWVEMDLGESGQGRGT